MTKRLQFLFSGGLSLVAMACVQPLSAQSMRDPTVAPGEQASVPGLATGGAEGMTVLLRDGTPYLVVGTRLYAVGDKVGSLRVDRISESEIWLHDGRAQIKVARFAGIERTAASAKPACTPQVSGEAPAPGKVEKSSRPRAATQTHQTSPPRAIAPCEDTQP